MTEAPGHPVPSRWEIQVFYDGECPLCAREIRMLERLDRGRGRIAFADIAGPGFDAGRYGLTPRDVMDRIHAALPDGRIIEGVEVFRRAYAAVGLGWLLAPTRWPGLRGLSDAAYRLFARNRLRLTGRAHACETGHCTLDTEATPSARNETDTGGARPAR
jgi:predicted DCC family thiol-disulfide oxidoreductase YuxK